ncbi:MAG: chemotaxis protein CheX [Opitutaceae bacterium]
MPATQEITERLVSENIKRAMTHVFQTMLGKMPPVVFSPRQNVVATAASRHSAIDGQQHVVGTVGFIGQANGLIYIYLPLPFARLCTRNLLGLTDREIDEAGEDTVNDAIGELTNMTVGSFKSGLCDAGYSCMLTMPSILRGSNFCIEPISSAVRHVHFFECAGHRIVTDILMKLGE